MKENSTIGHYNILRQLGAKLWLPQLKAAGFEAVLSGHTHRARHDAPTAEMPVHQFVGGGPKPEQATLTIIDAALANGKHLCRSKSQIFKARCCLKRPLL